MSSLPWGSAPFRRSFAWCVALCYSIREQVFVEAARALGQRPRVILARHVLPNAMAPIIVQATLNLGSAILVAAGLGFLGLGVQPPAAEWGTMLGEGRQYIFRAPLLTLFPGLAIFLAVLGFNLLGDGLRDASTRAYRSTHHVQHDVSGFQDNTA